MLSRDRRRVADQAFGIREWHTVIVYGHDTAPRIVIRDKEDSLHVSGRQAISLDTGHVHARCWQPQDKGPLHRQHTPPPLTVISRRAENRKHQDGRSRRSYRIRTTHSFRLRYRIHTTPRHHTHLFASPALGAGTIREDAINNPFQTRVTGCIHARITVAARAIHKCSGNERHDIRWLLFQLGATHRPRIISIPDFGILPAYMCEAESGRVGTVGWE